jgi:hypothetical protein
VKARSIVDSALELEMLSRTGGRCRRWPFVPILEHPTLSTSGERTDRPVLPSAETSMIRAVNCQYVRIPFSHDRLQLQLSFISLSYVHIFSDHLWAYRYYRSTSSGELPYYAGSLNQRVFSTLPLPLHAFVLGEFYWK